MTLKLSVHPDTFTCIQNVDIECLSSLSEAALRPILPCLVRMSLCAPLDTSSYWTHERKKILKCLSGIEVVNSLVGLLSIDFHELEQDARKEQQMRNKAGSNLTESLLISQLEQGVALEFERCDAARKLRLLLSELLFIISQVKEQGNEFYEKSSELFDSDVYLEEVSDVLCIAQAELPGLLPIVEVAEALLHVQNGGWLLCRLIANSPGTFLEVCRGLVCMGEKQDEETTEGRRRCETLVMLSDMCPSHALTIRSLCVEHCQQPALAVTLTLRHEQQCRSESSDCSQLVAFVSGLLLDNDANIRNWFAQFIRGSQRKKDGDSVVTALRNKLLKDLNSLLEGVELSERVYVDGCAFIRLFSALKCIAGIKFTDEEGMAILKLVTSKPPANDAGIRFICLGLCMLLACPTLLSNTEQEKQVIDWLKWLIREEQFERSVKASYGEMLLLIAIHFHSNQSSAISDLVSSTLGMKSTVKSSMLGRMKTIFTQEIFTEQVVTTHAVKVPVTDNLNSTISGYLPVHCIYQLLRSRAFSKHNVKIKDWIYKQLCNCVTPIHPLIPSLIEVYINSIILPVAKSDKTNEPISEEEVLVVVEKSPLHDQSHVRNGEAMQVVENEIFCDRTSRSADLAAQILIVYYVLLYEDILLQNMKAIVTSNRKVYRYSAEIIAKLPTKYLLQKAQKEPALFAGVYSSLLRLLATHHPHHFLITDWLEETVISQSAISESSQYDNMPCTIASLSNALVNLPVLAGQCIILLEKLVLYSPQQLICFSQLLISHLPKFLSTSIPRRCKDLMRDIWIKLNSIMPMSFRVATVNALTCGGSDHRPSYRYSEEDITLDPLIILRCDKRVFWCPPFVEIMLNILEAFLLASRSYLSTHAQSNVAVDKSGQIIAWKERDDLLSALVATEESAAVQILLESCLPNNLHVDDAAVMSDLREVQGLICSRIHQMFITDPALAKLVHFQGYPCSLLSLTVSGIPSMHICLDFVAELIAQPELDKQVFCIELISYLSIQYPIPKTMNVVKLALNVMNTLLCVLSQDHRVHFFLVTLPAVIRMCRAFPPLADDVIALLVQLGRVTHSYLSTTSSFSHAAANLFENSEEKGFDLQQSVDTAVDENSSAPHVLLCRVIRQTYRDIIYSTTLIKPCIPSHS